MKKAELEKELRKAKEARDSYHAQFLTLRSAAEALYYAAYWHADRSVPEAMLWQTLRDAARLPKGASSERLGADQTMRYEAIGHAYKDASHGFVTAHIGSLYLNSMPLGETLLYRVSGGAKERA